MKFLPALLLIIYCVNTPAYAEKSTSNFTELSFYTENYPPANYIENNVPQGISVDALKLIWKNLNQPEQKIHFVPWNEGYRHALDNSRAVLFTMSRTTSRENLFKWVGPLFHSSHVLIAKRSKQLNFKTLGQIFDYPVAAVIGDVSELALYQVGFPKNHMAHVTNIEQAFMMLESDRVEMIAVTVHAFADLVKQQNLDINRYDKVWEIEKLGNYLAFNKEISDEIITKYQQALDAISPELDKIKALYNLPLEEY